MARYRVYWVETLSREVVVEADGDHEALEEFWLRWHANSGLGRIVEEGNAHHVNVRLADEEGGD